METVAESSVAVALTVLVALVVVATYSVTGGENAGLRVRLPMDSAESVESSVAPLMVAFTM